MDVRETECSECHLDFLNRKALANHLRHGCNGIMVLGRERRLELSRRYYRKHKSRMLVQQKEPAKRYRQTPRGKELLLANGQRMIKKFPEKNFARYTLRNAVRLGKIQKQPCEICGDPKVEAHHDDYNKPFEVRWLCRQHHCELEGRWIPKESENR